MRRGNYELSGDERSRSKSTGVVLAGGRSTRFEGGDKALAVVDGTPMLARVVSRLGAVTDDVVVNCRAGQREGFERALASVDLPVRFAFDDRPDEGPLVGLDTALDAVSTPHVVVVACDLPFLDSAVLDALVAMVDGEPGSPDAAVLVDEDGFLKPTCAAYRTDRLAISITHALSSGSRRLRDALDGLDVRTVAPVDVGGSQRTLADVDTRAELERLVADDATDDGVE